ncbi:MAG: hypothetical protein NVS2B3_12630 [Vulcanimicrobiaceae bacterium]
MEIADPERFRQVAQLVGIYGSEADAVDRLLAELARQDAATSKHVRTVGNWCRRIAQTLGLSPAAVRYVERCGTLHDIGKIFTPILILTKPTNLTRDEWACMQAHAADGAQLLETLPPLRQYSDVVRAHHERLDGKGYPHRLAGLQIPYEAKIVAIADAFDAMIADRPYRPSLSVGGALDQLYAAAGTQFDASLVDTFASIIAPRRGAVVPKIRISRAS